MHSTFRLTIVALTLLVSASVGATMHLRLTDSAPAENAELVEPPTEIRLWFSQAPEIVISRIELTGPDGPVALTDVEAGEEDTLFAGIEGPLPAGDYEIFWRTSSADGHPIEGTIPFRITAAE